MKDTPDSQSKLAARWQSPVLRSLRKLAARYPWLNAYLALCLVCLPIGPVPVAWASPEVEEWSFDHAESLVEAVLTASESSVYSGATVNLTLEVRRHQWEVWVSDWGNVETREDTYEPLSEKTLSWSVVSGDGGLSGDALTDAQGQAAGSFVLTDSSDVRVTVLDAGSEVASAQVHIEAQVQEETWSLSQTETRLEVAFQPVTNGTLLQTGESQSLVAEARWHSFEVWTSNLGSSETRADSYTDATGADVTFTLLSGASSSLDDGSSATISTGQTNQAAVQFVMGNANASIGVQVTQGSSQAEGAPLSISYSPPEEVWSLDRTETVVRLGLSTAGEVAMAAQEDEVPVQAHAVHVTRDVWVSSLGGTRYENVTSTDAPGLQVFFSALQPLEGHFTSTSVTTGPAGEAGSVFVMGGVDAHLRAVARDANGSELATAELELGCTGEERWAKLRNETTISVSLDPGGSTIDVPPSSSRTVTASVSFESWEVWRSNKGGTDIRNQTSGAADGAAVYFSTETGGQVTGGETAVYTGTSGAVSTQIGVGGADVLLRADVQFGIAVGVATVDYVAMPLWQLDRTESALTVSVSASGGTATAQVSHSTWDVFRHIVDNTEEIRNRVTLPAGGASVELSMTNGTFEGQSPVFLSTNNNGDAVATYTRSSPYSDTEFVATASYLTLNATAVPCTIPGDPVPPDTTNPPPPGQLQITNTPNMTTFVDVALNGTIGVTGGTAPYTYSGPGVVDQNNSAFVAGPWSTPGTYQFTIGAADANANSAYKTITVTVVEPPANPDPVPGNPDPEPTLLPIEVKQPTINSDGSAGSLATVQEVRMCRWENPRTQYGTLQNRSEFPKDDPDRFVVHLPLGHRDGTTKINVQVSTTGATDSNYNDSQHEVEFTEEGTSGVFVSKPMALVVDSGDDDLSVGGASEGALNDPTFIAQPGGKIRLSCSELGSSPLEIPIKRYSHRVRYKQIDAGGAFTGENVAVAYGENRLRFPEIYNQIHVRDDEEHGVAVIGSNELESIYQDNQLTDTELPTIIAKVDSLGLSANIVKFIWVPRSVVPVFPGLEDGYVFGLNKRKDIIFLFLSNMALSAVTAREKSQVMAHELGHSLRGIGHYEQIAMSGTDLPKHHLMSKGGGNPMSDSVPDASGKHWYVKESESVKVAPAESISP